MSTQDSNDSNPFAPPSARVADVPAVTGELDLAGRGARLGAYLLDILIMLIMLILFAVVGFSLGIGGAIGFPGDPSLWSILSIGGVLVLYLLINGYYLVTSGQSLGKKAMHIRIVRRDGSHATAGRILGMRYVVNWMLSAVPVIGPIYSLVDALCIFRESRRCVHDELADTIVVRV